MCSRLFVRLGILIIPVSVFVTACVFNSDEEYFVELKKPDPASVGGSLRSINLEDYKPGDTIDIFGRTNFFLSVSGDHGQIESGTVYLDGVTVADLNGTSFSLGLFGLESGISTMKLDVIMRSGSGSLADVVGSEKIAASFKWTLRIDVSPPPPPEPTIDVVDGFLTIHWAAYSRPNFNNYVIKRKLPDGSLQTFNIENIETDKWRDETYVGGTSSPTEYTVAIVAETGTATSTVLSRADPVQLDFSFDPSDSTFTLNWTPTEFHGAFKQYRIALGNVDGVIAAVTNASESTYTAKFSTIRFGGDSYVGLSFQSQSDDYPEYWHWSTCNVGTPLSFAPVGEIKFNTHLNKILAVDADRQLIELNEDLEPVNTIATLKGTAWQMPYPGNYIYATSSAYNDNHIYKTNVDDQTEVSYDYFYLRSQNGTYSVASNGLICIDYDRPPVTSANIPRLYITSVFEPPDGSDVYHESSNTDKLSAVISEDGQFVFANDNRVFSISGGSSELIGTIAVPGTFMGFRPDKSTEMMFKDGQIIYFYDANTFELIRSIPPPVGPYSYYYWYGAYDIQTKSMLWKSNSPSQEAYTVNIETGATKVIKISNKIAPSDFYLVNGMMVYDGNYIRIQ